MEEQIGQATDFVHTYVIPAAKALVILGVGYWASGFASKLALRSSRNAKLSEALARFLGQAAWYTVFAMAAYSAVAAVGIETTGFLALFGTVGLAVGLALQGNLSHFASGVMILFFRPFDIDDVVTAGGHTGKVNEIGLFATTLFTPDQDTIIVPNGAITGGSIVNHTRKGFRRGSVDVGVAYGSDVAEVTAILEKAVAEVDLLRKDPGFAVVCTGLGASSVDFTILFHADVPNFIPAGPAVRVAAYNALNEAGVDIPFNQIVVHQASADA